MAASSGFNFSEFKAASEAFVLTGDRAASAFIESLLVTRCGRLRGWYEQMCEYEGGDSNGSGAPISTSAAPSPEMVFPHLVDLTGFLSDILSHATAEHLSGASANGSSNPSSSSASAASSFSPSLFTAVLLLKRYAREWLPQFAAYEKRVRYLRSPSSLRKQNHNNNGGPSINYQTQPSSAGGPPQQPAAKRGDAPPPPALLDPSAVSAAFAWVLEATPSTHSVDPSLAQQYNAYAYGASPNNGGAAASAIGLGVVSASAHTPIAFGTRLLAMLLQLRGAATDALVAIIAHIQNTALGILTPTTSGVAFGGGGGAESSAPVAVWSRDPVVKMLLHVIGVLEVLVWAEEPAAGSSSGGERKRSRRFGGEGATDAVIGGATGARFASICQEVLWSDVCAEGSSPNILENVMRHFTSVSPDFFAKISTSQTPLNPSADGSGGGQSLSAVASQLIAALCSAQQSGGEGMSGMAEAIAAAAASSGPTASGAANRVLAYYQRITSLLYVADRLAPLSASGLQGAVGGHQQIISQNQQQQQQHNNIAHITPNDTAIIGCANIVAAALYVMRNTVECLADRRISIDFMLRARVRASMQLGRDSPTAAATSGASPQQSSPSACATILSFIDRGLEQLLSSFNGIFSGASSSSAPSYAPFPTIAAAISGTTDAIIAHMSGGGTGSAPAPASPYWPTSLATILFYLQLSTETLTVCIAAGIETASLAGQIGATGTSSAANGGKAGGSKPVSPWGESFWLLLAPTDPVGITRDPAIAAAVGGSGNGGPLSPQSSEALLALECLSVGGGGGVATPAAPRAAQSLLWDFALKSGFVSVSPDNSAFRAPLLFSLAAAVRQLSATFALANTAANANNGGNSNPHQGGELLSLLLGAGLSNVVTANTAGDYNSGNSSNNSACLNGLASPLVASQVRVLAKALQPYTDTLSSAPPSLAALASSSSSSSTSNNNSSSNNNGNNGGNSSISEAESCPPMEVAVCDLIVKILEVIGIEGTCSIGCGSAPSASPNDTNGGGGGGYYDDDDGGYAEDYASSDAYMDLCAIAAAAITRGLRFVRPQQQQTSSSSNGGGALISAPMHHHDVAAILAAGAAANSDNNASSTAVCNRFVATVSAVSCQPLFLAVFMGIAEAAVALLDATTEKYVSSAVEVTCECCCYASYCPATLQQQSSYGYGSAADVAAAAIAAGNAALKHALFSAFTTTLTHVITDPVAFSVTPPIATLSSMYNYAQQQQQQQQHQGGTVAVPTVPLAFPLTALLTQRSQPVTANSNTNMMMSSSCSTSTTTTAKGTISIVRVLDIRLCAALELVSPSLAGLTMVAQALAPQSIPPMDEEADDPEDFGFSVVDHIDGENVRKRLTIAGLFSSSSSSSSSSSLSGAGAAEAPLQAPLLLPADSFFIAAAAKVIAHCLTSYGNAAKIEHEMGGAHALLSHGLLSTPQSGMGSEDPLGGGNAAAEHVASGGSLLLSELLAFLSCADDGTLLYGAEFHEAALHLLGDAAGVGGGSSAHLQSQQQQSSASASPSGGSGEPSDMSAAAATADVGDALRGLAAVPISGTDLSAFGASAAESLLNHQAGVSPSQQQQSSSSSSSAFRTGVVDIHKHSIAAFISAFMHVGAIANTSVTTRRSLLLYAVVGAMNSHRYGGGGEAAPRPILAPLTAEQLVIGRRADGSNANPHFDSAIASCGGTYMTAHDDEDTSATHPHEMAAALASAGAGAASVGAVVVPLIVNAVSDPPEKTVQQLMSLSSSGGGGNSNGGGRAAGSGVAPQFIPLAGLFGVVCGSVPSGVSDFEIVSQQPIAALEGAGDAKAAGGCASPLEHYARLQQSQQQQQQYVFPSQQPARHLSQMLQTRAATVRSDIVALLVEAACIPTPFSVLRKPAAAAAARSDDSSGGGSAALPTPAAVAMLPAALSSNVSLQQSRLAAICSDWLHSRADEAASASSSNIGGGGGQQRTMVNRVATASITEASRCAEEALIGGLWGEESTASASSGGNYPSAASGGNSSVPFPSLLSMPAVAEVAGWLHRLQSLLTSLRYDASETIPSFYNFLFSTVAPANPPPSQASNANGLHSPLLLSQNALLTRTLTTDFAQMAQAFEVYWHRVWQIVTMMAVRAERCLAGEAVLTANGYGSSSSGGGGGANNNEEWPQWLAEEYGRSRALLAVVDTFWSWFGHELAYVATNGIGSPLAAAEEAHHQQQQSGQASAAGPSAANTSGGALHRYRDLLCRLSHDIFARAAEASEDQLRHHTPPQVKVALTAVQRPQRLHNFFVSFAEGTVAAVNQRGAASAAISTAPTGLHELSAIIHWSLTKPLLASVLAMPSFVASLCGSDMSSTTAGSASAAAVGQSVAALALGMAALPTGCVCRNPSAAANSSSVWYGNVRPAPSATTGTLRLILNSANHYIASLVETAALQRAAAQAQGHYGAASSAAASFLSPSQVAKVNRLAQAALFAAGDVYAFSLTSAASALARYRGGDDDPSASGASSSPATALRTVSPSATAMFGPIASVLKALSDATAIVLSSSSAAATPQQDASPRALVGIGRAAQAQCLSQRNDLLVGAATVFFGDAALRSVAETSFSAISARNGGNSGSSSSSSCSFGKGSNVASAKLALSAALEYIALLMDCEASPVGFGATHTALLVPPLFPSSPAAPSASSSSSEDMRAAGEAEEALFAQSEALSLGWIKHISERYSAFADGILKSVAGNTAAVATSPSASTLLLLNPAILRAILGTNSLASSSFTAHLSPLATGGGGGGGSDASASASPAHAYLRQLWLPTLEAFAAQIAASGLAQPPPAPPTPAAFAERVELIVAVLKSLRVIFGNAALDVIGGLTPSHATSAPAATASAVVEAFVIGGNTTKAANRRLRRRAANNGAASSSSQLSKLSAAHTAASQQHRQQQQFAAARVLPAIRWALAACLVPVEQNLTYIATTVGAGSGEGSGDGGNSSSNFGHKTAAEEAAGLLRRAVAKAAVEAVSTLSQIATFYGAVVAGGGSGGCPSAKASSSPQQQIDVFPLGAIACGPAAIGLMRLVGIGGGDEAASNSASAGVGGAQQQPLPPAGEWQGGLLRGQFAVSRGSGSGGLADDDTNSGEGDGGRFAFGASVSRLSPMQMWRDEAWHSLFASCLGTAFAAYMCGSGTSSASSSADGGGVGAALLALVSNPTAFSGGGSAEDAASISNFYRLLSSVIGHGNPVDTFAVAQTSASSSFSAGGSGAVAVPVGAAQQHISYVLNRLRTSGDVGEVCGLWQQLCVIVSIVAS